MKTSTQTFRWLLILMLLFASFLPTSAEDTEKTIKHTDGTAETTRTTTYYDPYEMRIMLCIYGASILFGSIISYGGIRIISRSLDLGNAQTDAEVDLDVKKQKLKIKKIAQGSLVVLIGAVIILWSIYQMSQLQNHRLPMMSWRPNKITAHNAGWPSQFRFAGGVSWSGVCKFCR